MHLEPIRAFRAVGCSEIGLERLIKSEIITYQDSSSIILPLDPRGRKTGFGSSGEVLTRKKSARRMLPSPSISTEVLRQVLKGS